MNRIIKKPLLALLPLFAFSLSACNDATSKVCSLYQDGASYVTTVKGEAKPYSAVSYEITGGDEVMPIAGFYVPYSSGGSVDGHSMPDFLTEEVFQELEDCGINTFVYGIDRWSTGGENTALKKALDLCEEHSIGYYVSAYEVMAQLGSHTTKYPVEQMDMGFLESLINEISDDGKRKGFIGLHALDEPFSHEIDNLSVLFKAFYDLTIVKERGYDLFANALGTWEGDNNFYGYDAPLTYDEYMQKFFEELKGIKMLSATQYPFTSANTSEEEISSNLYSLLAKYRKYAKDNNVSHWRMLQAGGQWNDDQQWIESVSPYPSEGELLFDVNTSLAFGAKGIQYFPLIQPFYFAYEKGGTYDFDNRNGLIGADGNLTRWYYYAKRANTEIQAIDHVLMKSSNEGVIVHGDAAKKYVVGSGDLEGAYIEEGKWRELTSISGKDCIVGCFDYLGGTALYVVNYSRTEKSDIELSFSDNYRYEVIQRGVSADVVGNYIPLTLDTGEGALIVLK